MISRLMVAIAGMITLFIVFLKGGLLLLTFSMVVILLSSLELFNVIRRYDRVYIKRGLILSSLIPLLVYYNVNINSALIIAILGLFISEIFLKNVKYAIKNSSITLFVIVYISYLFSFILNIDKLPESSSIILFTFFLIWACDTFAYFVGIAIGSHKFSKISPKKSIEGLVGGFLGVLLTARYFAYINYFITYLFSKIKFMNIYPVYQEYFSAFNIKLVVFSIIITIVAVLGDLFESKIKREYKVKDSSNLLLGHGGFLDRFDSSLFVLPVMFIIMTSGWLI